MRLDRRAIFGVLLGCVLLTTPPLPGQRLNIRNYGLRDGLAGAPVWRIFQDARGVMWFATEDGISAYDGVRFQNVTEENGLPSAGSEVIVQARDGSLWFGTRAGLVRYDGRSLATIANAEGRWAGTLDPGGNLWSGDVRGLFVFDGRTTREVDGKGAGLTGEEVYSVTPIGDTVWVGRRDSGVDRVHVDHGRIVDVHRFGVADGLPSPTVHAVVRDGEGRIYFGTRGGGVARFDGRSFVTFDTRNGLPSNDVYALLVTRRGELVVGTYDNGIAICDHPDFHRCRAIGIANGLRSRSVFSLFEDREENLWIGQADGVSKLMSLHAESFTEQEGLPSDTVYAVRAEGGGDVWVGTIDGLAHRDANGRWQIYGRREGLPSPEVHDTVRDRAGRLWVATAHGLCVAEDPSRGFRCFTRADGLFGDYMIDLALSRSGDLLAGSSGSGYSRITYTPGQPLRVTGEYLGAGINSLDEDDSGAVWLGTEGKGVYRIDGHGSRQFLAADGLGSNVVSAVHADRHGGVWIGTHGSGLAWRPANGERFQTLGSDRGIAATHVTTIVESGDGTLWLGTNRGLYQIDPSAVASPSRPLVLRHIDERDGLISHDVMSCNALSFDARGNPWIGFSRGLTYYDAHQRTPNAISPPVEIVRVVIGGRVMNAPFTTIASKQDAPWPVARSLPLDHTQNNLRFEYRGLSFRDERDVRFRYKLDGFDRQWSPPTDQTFKEYTNLDPGSYSFRVMAANADGVWSVAPAAFTFTVRPPWWATTPFRLGALIFLLSCIAGVHKLRVRQIKRRGERLAVLVAERTADLEARQHELEEANQKIVEADRSKSRFLASVSHELRTPLNAVIGFSEILLNPPNALGEARRARFIENIHLSGHHLLNLINNLLDLSKIEAGKMELHVEEVSVPQLVENVDRVIRGFATQRGIRIHAKVPGDLVPAQLDSSKVKQILYNLLSNAIKFSPTGGTVDITVQSVSQAMSPLETESIEIDVHDQGAGIAEEERETIFEEFRQTRLGAQAGVGTGLGLAIVKHFAELHGGRVDVASAVGAGSTFRVVLPVDARPFAVH